MNGNNFHYSKFVKLNNYEFTKDELVIFFKFLTNSSTVNFELDNEKFNYVTNNSKEFFDVVNNSKSIISIKITIITDTSKIEFEYSTFKIIKNDCRIKIYASDLIELEKLENRLIDELRKYKSVVRKGIFISVSIAIYIIIFVSLLMEFFGNKFNQDLEMSSSVFLDIFFVAFVPTFLSLSLYKTAVPIFRIKTNLKFKGILKYIKNDYRSIIKDIIIALIFLIIGKFM